MSIHDPSSTNDTEAPLLPRRKLPLDNNLDMTPMIDVTFLLLIFFLVASIPDVRAALDLPKAEHGVGVSGRGALQISVVSAGVVGREAQVILGEDKTGVPLRGTSAEQESAVQAAAEEAVRRGETKAIVRAERHVAYRDVSRFVRAASVPGMTVGLAVSELE